jgi:hypothetical protein
LQRQEHCWYGVAMIVGRGGNGDSEICLCDCLANIFWALYDIPVSELSPIIAAKL